MYMGVHMFAHRDVFNDGLKEVLIRRGGFWLALFRYDKSIVLTYFFFYFPHEVPLMGGFQRQRVTVVI